ncbi:alpha/beta hydrolase-fold protein [Boseongicola aestuarii]|jgi:enterochelin esterase family protein|uniref:Endo-1,4-beta-xylanase/feruloyl esterase n=1 Tax=Boseongicola aestuarii TaxID=1470561 RepID=A0A238J4C6_9RHOB|nr:alpha/beta hydrolase-fold protein [Boseongicola aestuarii]SMX25599.1 Endo-1,4-beta-xylanase/feruloyl esterase precursor [Boseongicola aestuarii]
MNHIPAPTLKDVPNVLGPLFRSGTPDAAAIDGFVADNDFPLVEPGRVTFVWRGQASRVELARWIYAGSSRDPFRPLDGTDLWVITLPVEDNGRFEYKLAIAHGAHEDLILDPLNSLKARDPFGANSVCCTFGYERPDWTRPLGAPAGNLETLSVDSLVFGQTRNEMVYLPYGYTPDRAYPLVVIHDGQEFDSFANLSVSLDNLIYSGDVPGLIAVLIQTDDRMGEYPRGRRHARYLVGDLLPLMTTNYSITADPAKRVLLGASLGAVASISTAFRFPGVFGGLILNSGTFVTDQNKLASRPHPVFHRAARLVEALQRAPQLPKTRAYVSTGELEGLADENRALATFLQDHGVDVLFNTEWDGHHWHNWRDQLRDGLLWTLGENMGD